MDKNKKTIRRCKGGLIAIKFISLLIFFGVILYTSWYDSGIVNLNRVLFYGSAATWFLSLQILRMIRRKEKHYPPPNDEP
ncbi:MAG: hypothetical protein V1867_07695 [Candidatus Falkowbacteria bacterium]